MWSVSLSQCNIYIAGYTACKNFCKDTPLELVILLKFACMYLNGDSKQIMYKAVLIKINFLWVSGQILCPSEMIRLQDVMVSSY